MINFFIFRVKYNTCIVYIYNIIRICFFYMTNIMLGMLCYSFQTTDLSEAFASCVFNSSSS